MKWFVVGATICLMGIGSASAQPPPPNYAPIPPPRAETVPPRPGERVVWQPGHWHWDGYRYIWIRGRYIDRRPRYRQYVDGRWDPGPRGGRYVWVPAHWE